MDDLLTQYLTDACTLERKSVLLDACSVLESLGINDHYDYIDHAIMNAQDGLSELTIGTIESILYTKYVEAVNSYGIVLVNDVALDVMTHLCWGLNVIENWADPQLIFETIEASATPIDALSDILGLLCEEGTEEWFTYLLSVNPKLIDRIKETIAPAFVAGDVTDAEAEASVLKIARFNRYFTTPSVPVLSNALLQVDWRIGLSIGSLQPNTLSRISALTNTTDCAAAVLGFVLLSDCDDSEIETTVTQLLDMVYDNVNQQGTILAAIRNMMKAKT